MTTVVAHWTGVFKDLGGESEAYFVSMEECGKIKQACKTSGDTIPSAFGSRVPDAASEQWQFKMENWFTFLTFLTLPLLHGQLTSPYYKYFLKFVNIFNLCLSYVLYRDNIEGLRKRCANWIKDYERTGPSGAIGTFQQSTSVVL
ncbi:hypothetical protein CONPUDRAFT_68844 [Coniophora puteana RWD-64-598 SS2]|uniref:Uncharacterized protein n=1 Tax=Coniophora puteana (strain RWD-64-598) TaxID=741705 RepID=A0A5M3N4E2_CONPW|nr:uncharacterized protein CONPUDRAFT_68844 [Coniophora puteana RWD-64-598 SS2]EIW86292.1 hypothetical protein CONPUDRAFT_68844 [Coniophora puteana RWD-64-598 SS2]